VGNKIDLEDERVVPADEAKNYARDCKIPFLEITAKDISMVKNLFHQAVTLNRKKQR
jgi:hypothetical protein